MEKSVFFQEVKAELVHLRDTATQEEIKKLNFSEFDHTIRYACIYGQMTGNFDSARAKQLAPKNYANVGGKKFGEQSFASGKWYTALEKYLYICTKAQQREIFRYLRGKIDNIEIK